MGRLSEYDHVEREALRKGISRQPDPLPRGAVVAGEEETPRRIDLRRNTPAEIAIRDAVYRVEEMGADPRLTDVVVALGEALERVADFVDGVKSEPSPAQERIRALEEELEQARLRNGDLLGEVTRMDRQWCSAIVATQKSRDGRMVCDVEELLRWFNEHKGSAPGLVPDHDCELALDLTPHFDDGRVLRVGRITRPPDGLPQEKWCLHVKTPLKPELAFCLNEPDLNYLVVVAYACLGYHTDPGWVEALAGGSEPHHYATGRYPDQEKVERIRQLAKSETELMGAIRDREELKSRLEELRPVVRAAIQYKHQEPFFEPVQALSPATREWAEGEET